MTERRAKGEKRTATNLSPYSGIFCRVPHPSFFCLGGSLPESCSSHADVTCALARSDSVRYHRIARRGCCVFAGRTQCAGRKELFENMASSRLPVVRPKQVTLLGDNYRPFD